MQLTIKQPSQTALCGVLSCAMVAVACAAMAQSYYGAYYQPQGAKPLESKLGQGHGQPRYMHPTRDLYNKYFYHQPSVSPYLNLDRPTIGGTTAYHTFVRPEQQRREVQARQKSAYVATRKQQTGYTGISYGAPGKVGLGATSKARPNAYYNQWYGRR
jgi:hypothetical protein